MSKLSVLPPITSARRDPRRDGVYAAQPVAEERGQVDAVLNGQREPPEQTRVEIDRREPSLWLFEHLELEDPAESDASEETFDSREEARRRCDRLTERGGSRLNGPTSGPADDGGCRE